MLLVTSVDCQMVNGMRRTRHGSSIDQMRAGAEKACRVPGTAAV